MREIIEKNNNKNNKAKKKTKLEKVFIYTSWETDEKLILLIKFLISLSTVQQAFMNS